MSADAYVRMGSTHAICQDYAVAGSREGRPFAILSDGCSGTTDKSDPGSPHTDFGARFLVRSALRKLPHLFNGDFDSGGIVAEAMGMARQAELGRGALDATLLAAVQTPTGGQTFQTGDGVVAARHRDGSISYCTTSFGENAPYYLSYLLDHNLHRIFHDVAKTATTVRNTFMPGVGWDTPSTYVRELGEYRICQRGYFPATEHDVVLIMSDGAESFFDKAGEVVPLESVLEQVFAIKNVAGEFLTRRCNVFLHKFCAENGWRHADDFSVAGIHLGVAP
jgi:hypothetical protein